MFFFFIAGGRGMGGGVGNLSFFQCKFCFQNVIDSV